MTPIDQQIEQIEALALRHYPEDELLRATYLARLLTERLRAFHVNTTKVRVLDFDDLRRAGFTPGEISLGLQDIVR